MNNEKKLIILVVVLGLISLGITTGGFIYLHGKYAEQRALDEAKQKAQLNKMLKQLKSSMVSPPKIPAPPVMPYPEIELGGTIEDRGPGGGGGGIGLGGISGGGGPGYKKDDEGSHETQPPNQTKPKN